MVEAVPIVMQWPFERDIEFSISTNSRLGDPAGAQLLVVVPAVGAGAELPPAPVPVQHRPAGDDDRRDVRARRAEDADAGFVLSQPVSRTTPSSG